MMHSKMSGVSHISSYKAKHRTYGKLLLPLTTQANFLTIFVCTSWHNSLYNSLLKSNDVITEQMNTSCSVHKFQFYNGTDFL